MRKILVVGGAGYIGSHVCKALHRAGFRPVVLDNFSTGHHSFVRWGPVVKADVRNAAIVRDSILQFDISVVLHFAAVAEVGESVTNPAKYYDNNVVGTLGLLEGMRQANCSSLVFSSTCAVYGHASRTPIGEDTPMHAVNPYGASKSMVERILGDFASAYGLRAISLRYFNACGADAEGELGELHDPETHLIPRALMAVDGQIDRMTVFGTDFETPDGTAVRDYIHVEDLATAHVSSLRALLNGHRGGVYNLGTGLGYSVRDVLRGVETFTGRRLPAVYYGPRRNGDPAVLIADPARAVRDLDFQANHSDLATMIGSAWRWHTAQQSQQEGSVGHNRLHFCQQP